MDKFYIKAVKFSFLDGLLFAAGKLADGAIGIATLGRFATNLSSLAVMRGAKNMERNK